LSFILLVGVLFSGCTKIEQAEVKLGLKNNDFEYIKQGKIQKIVIQNTRDPGFRFVVSDKKAISELYDILSGAKEVKAKTTLEPDYVFEMQESPNKIYKFNYIAGLDKTDGGNFYSDNKIYQVSKQLDSDIISSLWTIRKPKEFVKIYYGMILEEAEKISQEAGKDKTIGINIYNDIDVAKFVFSQDLESLKDELKQKVPNAEIKQTIKDKNAKEKEYNIDMNIKTQGYKTFLYKAEITFYNRTDKSEKKHYIKISDDEKIGRWQTQVFDKKPDGF
jgi:hypothetical protein